MVSCFGKRIFYMKEENYYIEIENYIKRNETNKRRRNLEDNYDTLNNYWNIGLVDMILKLLKGEMS